MAHKLYNGTEGEIIYLTMLYNDNIILWYYMQVFLEWILACWTCTQSTTVDWALSIILALLTL